MIRKKTPKTFKPSQKLAHRVEWLALVRIGGLLRIMPLDWASGFMGGIWRVVAPMTHRHARAKAHLMAAYPDISLTEADGIIRDMWENLGRVSAETVLLEKIQKKKNRVTYLNPEVFAPSVGEGAVLLTMHAGNWVIVGVEAESLGLPIDGVYQKLKNPLSEDYLVSKRQCLYKFGLFSKGHDTGAKIISVLRKKGSVAFVADVRDVRGVRVNFFGQEAAATHIPAALARTMNKRLIAVRSRRIKGARFEVSAVEIPVARTKNRVQDAITTTQAIHDQFEKWIREDPSQWMWILKKWI